MRINRPHDRPAEPVGAGREAASSTKPESESRGIELDRQRGAVDRLEEPTTQNAMHLNRTTDDARSVILLMLIQLCVSVSLGLIHLRVLLLSQRLKE